MRVPIYTVSGSLVQQLSLGPRTNPPKQRTPGGPPRREPAAATGSPRRWAEVLEAGEKPPLLAEEWQPGAAAEIGAVVQH